MIWTALILGFAGSLHCMGMCSPLMMSVTNMSVRVVSARLLYNLGRILTYGIMGSVIAVSGFVFPMTKYQNLVSIIVGIALLVIAAAGISALKVPYLGAMLQRFSVMLKQLFSKFIQRRSSVSTLILGSLNGILPCGLSFLALTYCITLAGPLDGFMFMVWFGIGTLPVMLGFTSIFHWMMNSLSLNMRNLTTGMLVVSGLVLIARVFIVHLPHEHSMGQGVIDVVLCR